jgi:hypothetical protein
MWGPDAQDQISPFVLSFTRWLRRLSGQPWISDVDRHYPSILKRIFPIDVSGAAIEQVCPFAEMVTAQFRFVTDAMWQQAFELAAAGREVPIHSNLFFDAVNARAVADYARAVMNLAMALEACRNVNFSRLHPAKVVEGRGPRLRKPFNDAYFVRHVSKDAQKIFGRDFSIEKSEHWQPLKDLYGARQHVAHGQGPVFSTQQGLKSVDEHSYDAMQAAADVALNWMETLTRA